MQVVGDASPGVVNLHNISFTNWTSTAGCTNLALHTNPTSKDLNPLYQVSPRPAIRAFASTTKKHGKAQILV